MGLRIPYGKEEMREGDPFSISTPGPAQPSRQQSRAEELTRQHKSKKKSQGPEMTTWLRVVLILVFRVTT
jgi:hypothetical protein